MIYMRQRAQDREVRFSGQYEDLDCTARCAADLGELQGLGLPTRRFGAADLHQQRYLEARRMMNGTVVVQTIGAQVAPVR